MPSTFLIKSFQFGKNHSVNPEKVEAANNCQILCFKYATIGVGCITHLVLPCILREFLVNKAVLQNKILCVLI